MAYEKQNFVDGDILYAEHLNAIEDQIVLNSEHNHDDSYDSKGSALIAEASAKAYAKEQIQLAIDATWEASY